MHSAINVYHLELLLMELVSQMSLCSIDNYFVRANFKDSKFMILQETFRKQELSC